MTVEKNETPPTEGKKLKVTLLRSTIRSQGNHKETIKSLGLHRINDSRTLPDNPAVRGMIQTVRQWVKYEEV